MIPPFISHWAVTAMALLTAMGIMSSWGAAATEKPVTWKVADAPVCCPFALSPDGKVFTYMNPVCPGGNTMIEAWNTQTGRRLWSIAAGSSVSSSPLWNTGQVVFSPNQKWLACSGTSNVSEQAMITLRETRRGTVVRELRMRAQESRMNDESGINGESPWPVGFQVPLFSPDGNRLVAVDRFTPDTINMWNTETGQHLGMVHAESESVTPACFSPDGERLVAIGRPAKIVKNDRGLDVTGMPGNQTVIHVWNVKNGQERISFKIDDQQISETAPPVFSPDVTRIAYASSGNRGQRLQRSVCIRNMSTGKEERTLPMKASELRFASDGKTLFGVSCSGTRLCIDAADLETGTVKETFHQQMTDNEGHFFAAVFSPDGETVAVAVQGHVVRLLEARTGKERGQLQGPKEGFLTYAFQHGLPQQSRIGPLVFSLDGSRLISIVSCGTRGRNFQVMGGSVRVTSWDRAAPSKTPPQNIGAGAGHGAGVF